MEEVDTGWEDLRREARKLEGDLDVKLCSYAKLGGMLAHGGRRYFIVKSKLVFPCFAY